MSENTNNVKIKKGVVLGIIMCVFMPISLLATNNILISKLQNEIIDVLKRSQPSDKYGTIYKFSGSILIMDYTQSRGSDCPGKSDYKWKDYYDVSKLIASVSPPDGLRMKCDSNTNCRILETTPHVLCKLEPTIKDYTNSGWIGVDSPPEARRLEDLFYKLRRALKE